MLVLKGVGGYLKSFGIFMHVYIVVRDLEKVMLFVEVIRSL